MKIHPAGHRILVKLAGIDEDLEVVSEGGIIIEQRTETDVQLERHSTVEAHVVELGITAYKGFDEGEPWVKVGDRVLVTKHSGIDRVDKKTGDIYRIVLDEDVIGVIEE